MRYYCEDCQHEVPYQVTTEREPYEFWGECGTTFENFVICGLCGGYSVEEITEELFQDEQERS